MWNRRAQAKPQTRSAEGETLLRNAVYNLTVGMEYVKRTQGDKMRHLLDAHDFLQRYVAHLEAQPTPSAPAVAPSEPLQVAIQRRLKTYRAKLNNENGSPETNSNLRWGIEVLECVLSDANLAHPLVPSAPSMQAEDVAREIRNRCVNKADVGEDSGLGAFGEKRAADIIQHAIDGAVAATNKVWSERYDQLDARIVTYGANVDAANKRADKLADVLESAEPNGDALRALLDYRTERRALTAHKAAAPSEFISA